jgi:hypothetical protein
MNHIRVSFLCLSGFLLGICCAASSGCNRDEPPPGAGSPDQPIAKDALPKELVDPEFLNSLPSQFVGPNRKVPHDGLICDFPPEAPETEDARKLILWLLSLKGVKEIKPPPRDFQDEGFYHVLLYRRVNSPPEDRYLDLRVTDFPSVVQVSGSCGSAHLVRYYEREPWILKRIEELFRKDCVPSKRTWH